MAKSYSEILSVNYNDALSLAKFTKGYAFAYQLVGYLLWFNDKRIIDADIIEQFDTLIAAKAYNKIFEDLPQREIDFIMTLSDDAKVSNQDIMNSLKMKKNTLCVYKIRLAKKGIIDSKERGSIILSLPRFKKFLYQLTNPDFK